MRTTMTSVARVANLGGLRHMNAGPMGDVLRHPGLCRFVARARAIC